MRYKRSKASKVPLPFGRTFGRTGRINLIWRENFFTFRHSCFFSFLVRHAQQLLKTPKASYWKTLLSKGPNA